MLNPTSLSLEQSYLCITFLKLSYNKWEVFWGKQMYVLITYLITLKWAAVLLKHLLENGKKWTFK